MRVRETIVAVEKQKLLYFSVFLCALVRACLCSVAYSAMAGIAQSV
jgi:predicted membrane channel-forming protein YqfA (hemolysin III family)